MSCLVYGSKTPYITQVGLKVVMGIQALSREQLLLAQLPKKSLLFWLQSDPLECFAASIII